MTEIKPVRCYYLDLAKVITTILVILGHLYSADSTVRLYLYGYHMPLFFLISGIFHKYVGKINWRHYSRTILWPILIFIILSVITNVLFSRSTTLVDQLYTYFINIPLGKYKGILWFLFALFWCKVFLDYICGTKNKLIPFVVWGSLLFIPKMLEIRLPFLLSQGMMALPFYAFGYFMRDFFLTRKESVKWVIPFICCFALTVLITKFLQGRVSMVGVSFGHLYDNPLFKEAAKGYSAIAVMLLKIAEILLFYINGLIGSAMIITFSLLPFAKIKFISPLSKSLITVVGTQTIFNKAIIRYFGYNNSLLLSLVFALCVFALCYICHIILQPVYGLLSPHKTQEMQAR